MIRRLLTLCLTIILGLSAWSQSDQVKEMNKIKKNRNYLTVTGTSMVSEKESSDNALIMLTAEIEEWIKENAKGDVTGYTAKAKQSAGFIKTKIGSLYRTFAYVKKSDILPYYKDDIIIMNNQSKTERAGSDSQKEAIPQPPAIKVTQPQTDTLPPAPQNTAPQKSVTPAVEKNAPEKETTNTDFSILKKLFKKKKKDADKTTQTGDQMLPTKTSTPDYAEEAKMLNLLSANAVKKYLSNLIQDDKINRFGEIKDTPQQGVVYMLLSDYHGIVREYLRITDGKAVSLKSGESVALTNILKKYSTKYSIWFTLK